MVRPKKIITETKNLYSQVLSANKRDAIRIGFCGLCCLEPRLAKLAIQVAEAKVPPVRLAIVSYTNAHLWYAEHKPILSRLVGWHRQDCPTQDRWLDYKRRCDGVEGELIGEGDKVSRVICLSDLPPPPDRCSGKICGNILCSELAYELVYHTLCNLYFNKNLDTTRTIEIHRRQTNGWNIRMGDGQMRGTVEFYAETEHSALRTTAADERTFIEACATGLASRVKGDAVVREHLQDWLVQIIDVACRLRGYKAEKVHEERVLTASNGWSPNGDPVVVADPKVVQQNGGK